MSPLCISSVILVVNGYQKFFGARNESTKKRRELDLNEIKNHSGGTNLYVRLEHAREQSMLG